MQNKLQELTDRLYQEGLEKGKSEGEQILKNARAEAEAIIAKANDDAATIIDKARKEADDLKSKTLSDLKMASSQALQATRKNIEELIIKKSSVEKVKSSLEDTDFIKEIIREVAVRFSSEGQTDITLILPESLKNCLEPFVEKELEKTLGHGIESRFSKKMSGGFNIGPKDGSYFISFSDESFNELIGEYLRPATRRLLFGE